MRAFKMWAPLLKKGEEQLNHNFFTSKDGLVVMIQAPTAYVAVQIHLVRVYFFTAA
jgi:hypothetical protein